MDGELHPPRVRPLRAEWLVPVLLLCAVAATFSRTLSFQFVFDDTMLILTNPFVHTASNVPRYFTEHVWSGVPFAEKNYYRPMLLLFLLGNWKLFGAHPAGWHAVCLLLHLLNTLLIYLLARRLLAESPAAALAAGGAAALFGVHPVQAETVSWISCANDLLACLFLLGSLHAWLNARQRARVSAGGPPGARGIWYGLSLASYAAALLSKEPAMLFPVFLFVFALAAGDTPQRAGSPEQVAPSGVARLPAALLGVVSYLVIAAGYLAVRQHVLGTFLTKQVRVIGGREELLTLPSVAVAYLSHLLWPEELSPFYDLPYISRFAFSTVVLPLLAVLVPLVLLAWAAWRARFVRIWSAWALLFLAPVMHLSVLPRGELVHDRYLYVPMVGLSLLAAYGFAFGVRPRLEAAVETAAAARARAQEASRRGLFDPAWVAGALLAALALVSARQSGYWRDNFTLFLRGVTFAPNNGIAAGNLGIEYWKMGDREAATELFRRAATLHPDIFEADKKAGYGHYAAGRYAEAEQAFDVAVATRPEDAFSHLMLGLIYLKTGRANAAVSEGRRAVALAPGQPGFEYGFGTILEATGDLPGARDAFRAELAIRPDHKPSQEELHKIDQILSAAKSH
jgi:protein O-mannosyl-transferase